MANKQTAVDFLLHEISEIIGIVKPDAFSAAILKHRYDQAKAMEKEQIEDAWESGHLDYEILMHDNSQQYYSETYGSGH